MDWHCGRVKRKAMISHTLRHLDHVEIKNRNIDFYIAVRWICKMGATKLPLHFHIQHLAFN